ncbi:MAG: chromosome segregation protein SMC [Nitrospirae bacterium]|nr:chromosome segregation protein SMC [Nitrospirota bacterium]MBI3351867.1 chromosome segregation protein SMC [Nitrospirota bacterium]
MRLKKIEILGFKSFCDKTTINFQSGVTAVVGPNGCGKSNIADAILWVLGEQSAKTLRGEKMEDVIFNGTESRKSLGLSEVNLTLGDIATGQLSGDFSEYQELTITRRLYRSGESDYLINKIQCRLKDIRDLLIDTGAGAKGHTIIEQGKVDEILNSSPARRREIIEETAGISKYKIRRNEALRKLDATQQNLLRVRDIMGEVKKQMNSLDRQARKAERYQAVNQEMKKLEAALSVYEGKALEAAAQELKKELDEYEIKTIGLDTKLTQMDFEIEQARLQIVEKENELNRFIQNISEKEGQIQKQESRILLLESQLTEWKEQARQALEERARYQASFAEMENKKNDLKKAHEAVNILLVEKEKLLREKEREDHDLFEKVNRHRIEFDAENSNFTRIITETGNLAARMATHSSRREEIQKRLEKESGECEEVRRHLLNSKSLESEELNKQTRLAEAFEQMVTERLRLEEELKSLQAESHGVGEALSQKKEKLHSSRARLESLNDLQKNRVGYWQGIKSLLKGKETGEITVDLKGCVADFIEVQPQFEKAIESVLNEKLQGILVNSVVESHDLIQYLKSKNFGKGLFILREPRLLRGEPWIEKNEAVFGPALEKVICKPGYEKVVESLLGHVVIVKDLMTAYALWEQNGGPFTFVTLEGEVIEGSGMIWGGSKENGGGGLLQRQREIKELQNDVNQFSLELKQMDEEQAQLQSRVQTLIQQKKNQEEALHQLEIEKTMQANLLEKLRHDCERFEAREAQLKKEMEKGFESISLIDRDAQLLQVESLTIQESKIQLEERLAGLKRSLQEKMTEKDQLAVQLTEIKIEATSLKSKVNHTLLNLNELENSQKDAAAKIAFKEETALNLEIKQNGALLEKKTVLQTISELNQDLGLIKSQKTVLVEDHEVLINNLRTKEDAYRLNRKEIDEAVKKKNDLEVKWTEVRIKLEHIDQFLQTHYQTTLQNAMQEEYPELEYELAKTTLSELKAKIDQIGPVNVTAIDEFKELEERFNFLTAQEGDLTQSIQSLQEAIQKINKTTRILFNETFVALNQKFMEVFVSFFEGGKAELILLDDSNPFESGVDIIVQPPGKKVRNVSMLSGGEKALTAIALLFASFLIHPSPFCILDEIDAPLDEENIRRFTTVLKKMTDHSQFIVITHNKRTMEIADILYGVTQEEPGISRLISVRMNHAGAPQELQPVVAS